MSVHICRVVEGDSLTLTLLTTGWKVTTGNTMTTINITENKGFFFVIKMRGHSVIGS